MSRRKVTYEDVLRFFACNTEATCIDAVEALQVIRQTSSRSVSLLADEARLVRKGKNLIGVTYQERR